MTTNAHAPTTDDPTATAVVVALATAILIAAAVITFSLLMPEAIPTWCATHAGCP